MQNVHTFFNDKGEPRFRFIIEGANLFFNQEARIFLENRGVICACGAVHVRSVARDAAC